MELSVRRGTVFNRENEPSVNKVSGRRRSRVHERTQPQKNTQTTTFNRTRGIENLRRVLYGFVNMENENAYKTGSSLREEKISLPSTSQKRVVERSETLFFNIPLRTPLKTPQNVALPTHDTQQTIKQNEEPENHKRGSKEKEENLLFVNDPDILNCDSAEQREEPSVAKESQNLRCDSKEKQRKDLSIANETENLRDDSNGKTRGNPSSPSSNVTATPPMNVLLEVSRRHSRSPWHSPSSPEDSRTSSKTPSYEDEDKINVQIKSGMLVIDHCEPSKERSREHIFPSRVLHESKSHDVPKGQPFEELITNEKNQKLGRFSSHPRFNVREKQAAFEHSLGKHNSEYKDNIDSVEGAAVKECHKNNKVKTLPRSNKSKSKKLLRRLLCCSRRRFSSSSSTSSESSVKSTRNRTAFSYDVATNTSRSTSPSCLMNKATQTSFSHSRKQFSQDEIRYVKKRDPITKSDQSTATEQETTNFQETGVESVIPVHVKCSTPLSLKNKVDGLTRIIKFSDNEIIIEVTGNGNATEDIHHPKTERFVIEPSREYQNNSAPNYKEINKTYSSKTINIMTSKMDIPYVANIPAWIWNETPVTLTPNRRGATSKKNDAHNNYYNAFNESLIESSCPIVPAIAAVEETAQNRVRIEQQKGATGNIAPKKLISCYLVDDINTASSSNNYPNTKDDPVSEPKIEKNIVHRDAGTQTSTNLLGGINAFCQTTDCPIKIDPDNHEKELGYLNYEVLWAADKSGSYQHRISRSEGRTNLMKNHSTESITIEQPIIVNLSQTTSSSFNTVSYGSEEEQIKREHLLLTEHSSLHKTDGVDPDTGSLKKINLESNPTGINVSCSRDKHKTTDDCRTSSQRINRQPLIKRKESDAQSECHDNVEETHDFHEEMLPQIINASRPFLKLKGSDFCRNSPSGIAKTEEYDKTVETQNPQSSSSSLKSTNRRGRYDSIAENSKVSISIPESQQKQNELSQGSLNSSLSQRGTEIDRKSTNPNSKSTGRTSSSQEEHKTTQFNLKSYLSPRITPLQREKIKERLKSRSLISESQRNSLIDSNPKKESVFFKKSESPKAENKNKENTNLETSQIASQSSFIRPSTTGILFAVNESNSAFRKRDRFSPGGGVTKAPMRRAKPGKVPLVFGPPLGSVNEPVDSKNKQKEQISGKVPLVFETVNLEEENKEAKARPQITHQAVNKPSESEDEVEITPSPIKMISSESTSSSIISSNARSLSESMSSVLTAVSGYSGSTKPSIFSEDFSDPESIRSTSERVSKMSRSERVSSKQSEQRSSAGDVLPKTIDATIEEGTTSPQEKPGISPASAPEQRSSLSDSKHLPDTVISSVDDALTFPQEQAIHPSRKSEQRSSVRDSDLFPDLSTHSTDDASKAPREQKKSHQERSSVRDQDLFPDMVPHTADDVSKEPGELERPHQQSSSVIDQDLFPDMVLNTTDDISKASREQERPHQQRSSVRDADFQPKMILSTIDDPSKSPKKWKRSSSRSSEPLSSVTDSSIVTERDPSTSDDPRMSSKMRDSSIAYQERSSIRRSHFFPDPVLPTIHDDSKSPSDDTSTRKSDRALSSTGEQFNSTSGGQFLYDDPRGKSSIKSLIKSRESNTYTSEKLPNDSRPHSITLDSDEDYGQYLKQRSTGITKELQQKYSLPVSDDSSKEDIFRDSIISESRDFVSDLPDSNPLEPSLRFSDNLESKEWDTTVSDDVISYQSDSKEFTGVTDLDNKGKGHETLEMIVHPPSEPLQCLCGHLHVSSAERDKLGQCRVVDAKEISRQTRRHFSRGICEPVQEPGKSALNNMCEMFCNIFPCFRKFSVCCKRKSACNRKTPTQDTKKRKGRSSKSSTTSSLLCGKCEKCRRATVSIKDAPVQPVPFGQSEITVGYNFTNLHGVCMVSLENSIKNASVGVEKFAQNIFSGAMYPRDNSTSSHVFSGLHIQNKASRKERKMCSSELSSNLSSKIYNDFSPYFSSQEGVMNDVLCEDFSEYSEKYVFTTHSSLTGPTISPSSSNASSLQCQEQSINSPPTTSCLFDLFSSSSKKLVLSEFYRKNYRNEKTFITLSKKKFLRKVSSQVININVQTMKPQNVKKGHVFQEYSTNPRSNFMNHKNKQNKTSHTLVQNYTNNALIQKCINNHQRSVEENNYDSD